MNQPRPLRVLVAHGQPAAVIEHARRLAVVQIQDSWTIEDEWWRQPVRRRYFCLLLEGGILRTVYHDLAADTWHAQEY
jgi:hypothetical protein